MVGTGGVAAVFGIAAVTTLLGAESPVIGFAVVPHPDPVVGQDDRTR